jgi:hypothetical protein
MIVRPNGALADHIEKIRRLIACTQVFREECGLSNVDAALERIHAYAAPEGAKMPLAIVWLSKWSTGRVRYGAGTALVLFQFPIPSQILGNFGNEHDWIMNLFSALADDIVATAQDGKEDRLLMNDRTSIVENMESLRRSDPKKERRAEYFEDVLQFRYGSSS